MPDATAVASNVRAEVSSRSPGIDAVCCLCGLPLGGSSTEEARGGATHRFCCPGCRQVFLLLCDDGGRLPDGFQASELYQASVQFGVVPGGKVAPPAAPEHTAGAPQLLLELHVDGMWCPACAWLIEEVLKRAPGVASASASFLSDTIRVQYQPHATGPEEIMARIARLGYHTSFFDRTGIGGATRRELLLRLGVSAILTMNVMMLSYALYAGFFVELPASVAAYLSYPLAILATPVVFYGGAPILRRALAEVRFGLMSMDTLVSIGVLAAYGYSLVRMAAGGVDLYFDTATMLVTMVLLGRYIEWTIRQKSSSGITELYELSRQKARLVEGTKERWVSPDAVRPGMRLLVRKGERVSVDGQVVSGVGMFDQSVLTGESRPAKKTAGDRIMAGSLLQDGEITFEATKAGREGSLLSVISSIEEALARSPSNGPFVDAAARWFAPVIVATAVGTGLVLLAQGTPLREALLRAVTVLLIACPCALGVAGPLACAAVVGLARRRGIIVRDPASLGNLRKIDAVVFDKTGTVTDGRFLLSRIITDGTHEDDLLSHAAAVERGSPHFLAAAIVCRTRERGLAVREARSFRESVGRGVVGWVQGVMVCAGSRRFVLEQGLALPPALEESARRQEAEGMTAVYCGWNGTVRGLFLFGDAVRAGFRDTVRRLREGGTEVWLVSGDSAVTTACVASSLGIDNFRGEMLPHEKAELIAALREEGRVVGMVGDGLNDASALACADVGIAFGTGAAMIQEASDVTIIAAEPGKLLEARELASIAVRASRQNLFFAFGYNIAAIPLAMSGLLNPLVAVAAMSVSSLTLVGNALHVTWKKLEVPDESTRHTGSLATA